MEMLKAVYTNEIFKISKKKKITATLILFSALSVIVLAIVVYSLNNFGGIRVTEVQNFQ